MRQNVDGRRMDCGVFGILLGAGMCLMAVLIAPLLVGRYLGHTYGGWTAVIGAALWLYGGRKVPMAQSTRLLWLVGFVFFAVIGVFEFSH